MSVDEETGFVTKNMQGDMIEVVPRKVYDRIVGKLESALTSYRENCVCDGKVKA
jgi:hypothetical protein